RDFHVTGVQTCALPISNPDIASYRDRGGKMILYHGSGDSGPNAVDTANYYDAVVQRNGSYEATAKFARLFLVPGMGHCQGGPSRSEERRVGKEGVAGRS